MTTPTNGGERVHELKTWPEPFAAILYGSKRHEVRKNDRGYAVGDVLHLREWRPHGRVEALGFMPAHLASDHPGDYTGRQAHVRVTHLTPGGSWGLPADLCVMSIEPVTAESRLADVQGGEADAAEVQRVAAILRKEAWGGSGVSWEGWRRVARAVLSGSWKLGARAGRVGRERPRTYRRLLRWLSREAGTHQVRRHRQDGAGDQSR